MPQKLKKPVVLGDDGLFRLVRSDETLDASAKEVDQVALVNGEASAIKIGSPVYISGSMTAKLAKADGIATRNTFGLVAELSILNGVSGNIQTDGQIVARKLDWDIVLGLIANPITNPNGTGLTPGAMYYLSETATGELKVTPPSTGWVQKIGIAVSETVLDLSIAEPIGLN